MNIDEVMQKQLQLENQIRLRKKNLNITEFMLELKNINPSKTIMIRHILELIKLYEEYIINFTAIQNDFKKQLSRIEERVDKS